MAIVAKHFGLVGRKIDYSFSKSYFTEKFRRENLPHTYENFDIADISEFRDISRLSLTGLNVTIPYKESVIPFLDELSETASAIGAVNTVKFCEDGKLKGYNTDYYGFTESIKPLLQPGHRKALVLGTGGASKAVAYALGQLGIEVIFASRKNTAGAIAYTDIDSSYFCECQIVINCTPLGTFPETEAAPEIPYSFFTPEHIAYDLIYNPSQTRFLELAAQNGAATKNGMDMLVFQAEKAWEIWEE